MSDEPLTYSPADDGPHFTLSRTTLHVRLSEKHRRRALARLWPPLRSLRFVRETALRRIEGPHLLTHLHACLTGGRLRLGLPSGRSIHWTVPSAERESAERFFDRVAEHTLARRRHLTEVRPPGGHAGKLLTGAAFALLFRWLARVIRRLP